MSTVTAVVAHLVAGDDTALIPLMARLRRYIKALSEVNHEPLASWFPGFNQPPTLEGIRAALERSGQARLGDHGCG
jgi:hypothetical protein